VGSRQCLVQLDGCFQCRLRTACCRLRIVALCSCFNAIGSARGRRGRDSVSRFQPAACLPALLPSPSGSRQPAACQPALLPSPSGSRQPAACLPALLPSPSGSRQPAACLPALLPSPSGSRQPAACLPALLQALGPQRFHFACELATLGRIGLYTCDLHQAHTCARRHQAHTRAAACLHDHRPGRQAAHPRGRQRVSLRTDPSHGLGVPSPSPPLRAAARPPCTSRR
jgi:hypothetical protein